MKSKEIERRVYIRSERNAGKDRIVENDGEKWMRGDEKTSEARTEQKEEQESKARGGRRSPVRENSESKARRGGKKGEENPPERRFRKRPKSRKNSRKGVGQRSSSRSRGWRRKSDEGEHLEGTAVHSKQKPLENKKEIAESAGSGLPF